MKQHDTYLCPLCHSLSHFWLKDRKRRYFQCTQCALIFADPASHLSAQDEREQYCLHENDPQDHRYRQFLAQLSEPLIEKLPAGSLGLDFGCGPGPTLNLMLQEAGMEMAIYDPFYYPDDSVLARQYDFVTCSEVVEHFCHPAQAWAKLVHLVKPGGWLGVMTWMVPSPDMQDFKRWIYKGDPTHVSFYSKHTMNWIGLNFGYSMEFINHRVILMQRATLSDID